MISCINMTVLILYYILLVNIKNMKNVINIQGGEAKLTKKIP